MAFKKGQTVAKLISIMGTHVVAFGYKVTNVSKKGVVSLYDSGLKYDAKGREIDPVIPGCNSYILTQEEAAKRVREGRASVDGGEEIPKGL